MKQKTPLKRLDLIEKQFLVIKKDSYHTDLMKGIIINIRNGENNNSREVMKKSQNALIAMLEELLSEKDAAEKKRILADEYGMAMTADIERRLHIMCNLSESIEARGFEKGIIKERIATIERMIKANATKAQIISYGYTEAEYAEAESSVFATS